MKKPIDGSQALAHITHHQMSSYQDFLSRKAVVDPHTGIEFPDDIHETLFDFQADIVTWALRRGRGGVFAGTGLGKTGMQCEWSRHVVNETKRPVLILAPLAVSAQTVSEAEKLIGLKVVRAESQEDINGAGVYITNYQKLHRFDPSVFGGVAMDESSIVKNQDGKTRNALIEAFAKTPFRLACTATPAPNDFMEIGNHAELLGVMGMSEMLSTFFVHDGGETQKWRLKGHAKDDFYKWMASWSVCIQNPGDLGYNGEGYDLPPLVMREVVVASKATEGELFAGDARTLQERRQAKRDTISDRVAEAAKLSLDGEQRVYWCNLNSESEAIAEAIPDAVEITGSDTDEHKERAMMDFAAGKIRILVTKPSLAGFGMNWQNCCRTTFVGLSDSFEQLYQAIRRFYRFGQKRQVEVEIIISDREGAVLRNIKRKEAEAMEMQRNLIAHMADISRAELGAGSTRTKLEYNPHMNMVLPKWINFEKTKTANN